jgi:hypothetical protein
MQWMQQATPEDRIKYIYTRAIPTTRADKQKEALLFQLSQRASRVHVNGGSKHAKTNL